MKKLFIPFTIIFVLGCGTDQGEGTFYKYTVRNESSKNIKIKSYLSNFPDVSPAPASLQLVATTIWY